MQSVLVAVDPVSLSNSEACASCKAMLVSWFDQHICPKCGLPQPIGKGWDYFVAFGVPKRFSQDRKELEKRFYELSRALHPDRFSQASEAVKSLSLQRMSFLNQAYKVLKNSELLRDYILQLDGISIHSDEKFGAQGQVIRNKVNIPLELAEAWFELQDLLMEGSSENNLQKNEQEKSVRKFAEFEEAILNVKMNIKNKIISLESEYDLQPSYEILKKLEKEIQLQNYLKSLERDVAAKRSSFIPH